MSHPAAVLWTVNHRDGVERSIEALASEQFGVVGRDQVLERGATRRMIGRRLASGAWTPSLPGVYALAAVPESETSARDGRGALERAGRPRVPHQRGGALGVRRDPYVGRSHHRVDRATPAIGPRHRSPDAGSHTGGRRWIRADRDHVTPSDRDRPGGSPRREGPRACDRIGSASAPVLGGPALLARRRPARAGRAGSARMRRVLARRGLGRSESGWEVRVAQLLERGGPPPPVRQHEARVSGRLVARIDLACPDEQVARITHRRGCDLDDRPPRRRSPLRGPGPCRVPRDPRLPRPPLARRSGEAELAAVEVLVAHAAVNGLAHR